MAKSLLMWECGLKQPWDIWKEYNLKVTPYVGVWIETRRLWFHWYMYRVTPYVGVWIETSNVSGLWLSIQSLLMWECGLKLFGSVPKRAERQVTPYVGVWIETQVVTRNGKAVYVTPYVGVWIETIRIWLNWKSW